MSKQQFEAVRELILEKKYAEARALLRVMDHPTARKWEAKLDELDSESSFPEFPTPPPKPKPSRSPNYRLTVIVAVLGVMVAMLLVLNMGGYFSPKVQNALHAEETKVARSTDIRLTNTAYYATAYAMPTATNTLTPTPTPTPVVIVTAVFPQRMYTRGSISLNPCPRITCQSHRETGRDEAMMVVGVTVGDIINHKSDLWYKVQILDDKGVLVDYYAPSILFSDTPTER